MKKLFACGLMIFILSAPCMYAIPQDAEPDRKARREQRREERRQQKELRKQERKQQREQEQEQPTPQQSPNNNTEPIITPPKPTPQEPIVASQPVSTTVQTSNTQVAPAHNEVITPPQTTSQSYQASETQILGEGGYSSSSDWSGTIIFILVCGVIIWILSFIFSGKCRNCGKYMAMEEINRVHLGTVKSEWVKDSKGKQYQVHTNRHQIYRQCKYCGFKDHINKLVKGDEQ